MVKSNVDTGEDFETSRSWARRCPQCFNGITYIHQDDSFTMLIAQATARSFSVCILLSSYNDTSFNLILLSRICMPLGSLCQDHKHHWAGISRGSERVMQLSPFAGAPLGIRGTTSITRYHKHDLATSFSRLGLGHGNPASHFPCGELVCMPWCQLHRPQWPWPAEAFQRGPWGKRTYTSLVAELSTGYVPCKFAGARNGATVVEPTRSKALL